MSGKVNIADLNAIWVALQELGAALTPVAELGNPPRWASRLRLAIDNADRKVTQELNKLEAAS